MVVVTQAIEPTVFNGIKIDVGGTLKLNLNSMQKNKEDWLNILREGNVLDVDLYQVGKVVSVSKYNTGKLIKEALDGLDARDFSDVITA